jgi:hypothetical protein
MSIHKSLKKVTKKSLTLGDIFEIHVQSGYFYIQYCNYDRLLGYLVRLIDIKSIQHREDISALSKIKTKYYFFYALVAANKRQDCTYIGLGEIPDVDKHMPALINPFERRFSKLPPRWEIIDPRRGFYHVDNLSEKEKHLSIQQLVGHEILEIYLLEDWTPYKANTNYEKFGTPWIKPGKL